MIKKLILCTIIVLMCTMNVEAHWRADVKDVTMAVTKYTNTTEDKTLAIDDFLFEHNNYTFKNRRQSLSSYWLDGVGDCTEIARLKYIMYKYAGVRTRIAHGCVMIPRVSRRTNRTYGYKCSKHDYVEYHNGTEWISTEYRYYNYTLRRASGGLW